MSGRDLDSVRMSGRREWHLLSLAWSLQNCIRVSNPLATRETTSSPRTHLQAAAPPLPPLSSGLDQGPVAGAPLVQEHLTPADATRQVLHRMPSRLRVPEPRSGGDCAAGHPHQQDAHQTVNCTSASPSRRRGGMAPEAGFGDRRPVPPLLAAEGAAVLTCPPETPMTPPPWARSRPCSPRPESPRPAAAGSACGSAAWAGSLPPSEEGCCKRCGQLRRGIGLRRPLESGTS